MSATEVTNLMRYHSKVKEIRFFQQIGFLMPPLFDIEYQRNPIFPTNRISHAL
jgi:hypothetical protein